jgi:transcriptional regulator with XRE-family HTH domain
MTKGQMIRKMREAHQMTQAYLAHHLNISQRTVSSWENDRTSPNFKQYQQMSDIFGCSIDELSERVGHKVSQITIEDIVAKIPSFNLEELEYLDKHISDAIEMHIEMRDLEQEHEALLKRMQEYEARMKELGMGGGNNGNI